MRIVLDLQGAQTGSRFRGIGRYSVALAQAIARNAGEHEVWIVLNGQLHESIEDVRSAFDGLISAKHIVVFDVPPLVSWESPSNVWRRRAAELIRESFISGLRPDVVHVSSLFEGANQCNAVISAGTFDSRVATAVTLYDLIPLLDPENYLGADWVRSWYTDKVENLKRADLLLSISEHTRQEAMDALGFEDGRIVNISTAHTDNFRPVSQDEIGKRDLLSRYGITLPYVMYNGALESRKNLDRLLQAFSILPLDVRNRHQLVFVGKVSDFDRLRLRQLAQGLGINDQFVLAGHVSDDDLVALFTHCALFAFPSLHEGFGLPALEAMACGAPTIGSNVTSIPEVIGRLDALFDPLSPDDIARKIIRALTDEDFRLSLCQHALVQASKFSWDICAKNAISAFEKLHEDSPRIQSCSWDAIVAEQELSYKKLINAIADIHRQPVAPSEEDLISTANCIASNRLQTDRVARTCELPDSMVWRIEGPFDSSYSLALLNRETARALDGLGHRVILHSTEGPGDYPPNQNFLNANPDIARLHTRSLESLAIDADVISRNLYPPRVADMDCRMNLLHHYAWEESGFPSDWVENFNEYLQGLTCLSNHVEKIMIDHGVKVPMSVSGCGVDHWERIDSDVKYQLGAKPFRLLHVSSCFPRKGADLLLDAYGRVFTSGDDVTLVIKTFPNPHNEIHEWLANARSRRSDFPDVLIIEDDLPDTQLKALYEQCHVLIAPSRAEGFGLPMAEAMLSGLSVITTGWGGQLDFCNEKTAWLVDYSFEPANTHFGLFDSVWAKPDVEHLSKVMREVYDMPSVFRNERAARGKELLLAKFCWSDVAKRLVSSARHWSQMPVLPQLNIGWVTTWNTRCGIATYSAHLVENMPADVTILAAKTNQHTQLDEPQAVRCWSSDVEDSLSELAESIDKYRIDTLVVQFNYSFFDLDKFGHFLNAQLDAGRIVVLMMHSTSDPVHILPHMRLEKIRKPLLRCHRILVHTPGDLNRLKALGLIENVTLFPHGIREDNSYSGVKSANIKTPKVGVFTIASYGFFLPHKGLLELIQAVALLKQSGENVRLHMINAEYPVPESTELIRKAKDRVTAMGLGDHVQITTDFLSDEESLSLLADADLIVFPYQITGESASGAVRYGLSTKAPVAVTPLPIFDDVSAVVHRLPGQTPEDIARGIRKLIDDIACNHVSIAEKDAEATHWRTVHSYKILSNRLYGMIQSLQQQRHLSVLNESTLNDI